MKVIKARCGRFREQTQHLEFETIELQTALQRSEMQMDEALTERDEVGVTESNNNPDISAIIASVL